MTCFHAASFHALTFPHSSEEHKNYDHSKKYNPKLGHAGNRRNGDASVKQPSVPFSTPWELQPKAWFQITPLSSPSVTLQCGVRIKPQLLGIGALSFADLQNEIACKSTKPNSFSNK